MRRLSLGLLLVLPLAAVRVAAQEIPSQLATAMSQYFHLSGTRDTSTYRSATVDLNGDGRDDAVVLMEGPTWCGSGGCTILVFKGTPSGFRFVSRSAGAEAPVRVSTAATRGWKTLLVHARGDGDVLMRYDGKGYPSNASVQFAATPSQTNGARTILKGK